MRRPAIFRQADVQRAVRAAQAVGGRAVIVRENHPYDRGYWRRYDGLGRPRNPLSREGWDDCNREMAAEERERQGLPFYGDEYAERLAWAQSTGPAGHPQEKAG